MKPNNLLLVVILGALTAFPAMSVDMYLPGMPVMATDFNVPSGRIQLTLGASFLALALGQTLYGSLADRFGRKPPLYAGLTLYMLGSIGCALSPSVDAVIFFRFLQGLGGCAGVVLARAIVRDLYPPHEAARTLSTLQLVMILSPILAPMLGTVLLGEFGWRSIFWALSLGGLIGLVAVFFKLPETRPNTGHTAMGIGRMLSIYPILMSDRRYMGWVMISGSVAGMMFAYLAGSPFLFINYFHVSSVTYSLIFSSMAAGIAVTIQINRTMIKRGTEVRSLVRSGIYVQAAGATLFAIAETAGVGGPGLAAVFLLLVVSPNGVIQANSAALAMASYAENAGAAAALYGTLYFLCGLIAIVILSFFTTPSALPLAYAIFGSAMLGVLVNCLMIGNGAPAASKEVLPKN